MARRYEYIIHGPPLPSSQINTPRKSLHSRHGSQKVTNLRSLYRNSASPTQNSQVIEALLDTRESSPTTPKLPPTPPLGNESDTNVQEGPLIHKIETSEIHPLPTTPVHQQSPPTPDDTPPRNTLKAPLYPQLTVRPSFASTRAESFRTAYEHIHSNDDFGRSTLTLHSTFASPETIPEPTRQDHRELKQDAHLSAYDTNPSHHDVRDDLLPEEIPLPDDDDDEIRNEISKDTPETQFRFDHITDSANRVSSESVANTKSLPSNATEELQRHLSVHEQVTTSNADDLKREKSLRDRLHETQRVPNTASTEAFANVIGWNDGRHHGTQPDVDNSSNRWSGNSNPSAVEAFVVDSPIKPQKRGTLRKVVKNDSLRAVSSPIPNSKRASLQSTTDSSTSHRLVHKKAKLTNQNRWSTGSDISRRSSSWTSPTAWPKTEVITVAIIPERSSFHTSASSSLGHSRSISANSGSRRAALPPVSTPVPRRRRAFSDSLERTLGDDLPLHTPIRQSLVSSPGSRSPLRAHSPSTEQFSLQRRQAEKDLRITLDRMESERLSSSIRRSSLQSCSPTPASNPVEQQPDEAPAVSTGVHLSRNVSSAANSSKSGRRLSAFVANGIQSRSREGSELRPPTIVGTPFSQTSMASASPEIIEAKVISFFPHNNESLQLIEPNRLSESQAVKALKDRPVGRPNTAPAVKITTPRTSDHLVQSDSIDSPLRNPRKPPDPPRLELTPATPLGALDKHTNDVVDATSTKSQTGTAIRRRPSLQGRDRSESFMKQLARNFSTRSAKNPKANQDLDGATDPFWRPRAFWEDTDVTQKARQKQEQDNDSKVEMAPTTEGEVMRSVTVLEPRLPRSNSIPIGPIALVRRFSEKKRQKKVVDDHLVQQQALVRQSSFSSLQKLKAGRRLYGMPPIRSVSLNMGMGKLRNLQDKVVAARLRRENTRREKKREALRRSIGAEVVSTGDSRFLNDKTTTRTYDPMAELMENAKNQELLDKIAAREARL